jgi:polar amino acid transport system ATP-binding protein
VARTGSAGGSASCSIKAEGMTMIFATHEMTFARAVANEVWFLHQGRDPRARRPGAIFDAPRAPETQRFLERVR